MYTFPLVFNPSNEIAARSAATRLARNIFYRVGEIFFKGSGLLSTYAGGNNYLHRENISSNGVFKGKLFCDCLRGLRDFLLVDCLLLGNWRSEIRIWKVNQCGITCWLKDLMMNVERQSYISMWQIRDYIFTFVYNLYLYGIIFSNTIKNVICIK